MKRTHEIPVDKEYSRLLAIKADAEWGNEKPDIISPMTEKEERFLSWANKVCTKRREEGKGTYDCIELPSRWFDYWRNDERTF